VERDEDEGGMVGETFTDYVSYYNCLLLKALFARTLFLRIIISVVISCYASTF